MVYATSKPEEALLLGGYTGLMDDGSVAQLGTLVELFTRTAHSFVGHFIGSTCHWGYTNSIIYVSLNTIISLAVAVPAAYACSRVASCQVQHIRQHKLRWEVVLELIRPLFFWNMATTALSNGRVWGLQSLHFRLASPCLRRLHYAPQMIGAMIG